MHPSVCSTSLASAADREAAGWEAAGTEAQEPGGGGGANVPSRRARENHACVGTPETCSVRAVLHAHASREQGYDRVAVLWHLRHGGAHSLRRKSPRRGRSPAFGVWAHIEPMQAGCLPPPPPRPHPPTHPPTTQHPPCPPLDAREAAHGVAQGWRAHRGRGWRGRRGRRRRRAGRWRRRGRRLIADSGLRLLSEIVLEPGNIICEDCRDKICLGRRCSDRLFSVARLTLSPTPPTRTRWRGDP